MHYIRLMRPPSLDGKKNLKIVLTITTDLGDSFLSSDDESVPISVWLTRWPPAGAGTCLSSRKNGRTEIFWRAGMRVLKLELPVPDEILQGMKKTQPLAAPTIYINASHNLEIAPKAQDIPFDQGGRVLAVQARFPNPADEEPTFEALREFALPGQGGCLRVCEEIGESIDRHVWDAGVITMGLLLNMCQDDSPGQKWDKIPSLEGLLCSVTPEDPLNIIELGCGVGILGLGLAAALSRQISPLWDPEESTNTPSNILLTDLPDAEEVATRNIASEKQARELYPCGKPNVRTEFESLDWEDGKTGKFGPRAKARSWDLIIISDCTYNVDMLSALVGTISALHKLSLGLGQKGPKVMLATKPRHSSEKALFGLMEGSGWIILEHASQTLPVLGMEDESVEIYLFGKDSRLSRGSQESTSSDPKRRKLR